jgi:hypothetical protein
MIIFAIASLFSESLLIISPADAITPLFITLSMAFRDIFSLLSPFRQLIFIDIFAIFIIRYFFADAGLIFADIAG